MTLDEEFEGSWSKLFTHFPPLPALSVLSCVTRAGFSLVVPGASPTLQSSSFGSMAFLLCSLSLGYRAWEAPADFHVSCFPSNSTARWEKPSWCSRFPVTPSAGRAQAVRGPRSAGRALPGLGGIPGLGGDSLLQRERLCREREPFPGACSNLV